MVMTSDAVRHDLAKIEALIALLGWTSPHDSEDFGDFNWLIEQRACLRAILAIRRAQKGRKVVSLALWRDGMAATAKRRAKAA